MLRQKITKLLFSNRNICIFVFDMGSQDIYAAYNWHRTAIGHCPNPMVGCVIVHNDTIIGEGYHQRCGFPHAEVNAINSVKAENESLLPESTLYVNLEPCSHYGKTPPCSQLIITKKIKRVVIGMSDPNEKVNGNGIEQLRKAGIDVTVGVLEQQCRQLNRRFITFQTKNALCDTKMGTNR